jgi:hypothetical protein
MCKVGDTIKIIDMQGEPDYAGRTGIIQSISVDPWGDEFYRGTWGGLSIYPSKDRIEVINNDIKRIIK